MRIIAGKWKGKSLSVSDEVTRPSMDRTRQALFNILQNVIEGASVLDLYAGSGAISIEAVSRGASHAMAVEKDKHAAKVINKNLRNLNVDNVSIVHSPVIDFLEKQARGEFSLVFADPPYDKNFLGSEVLKLLNHSRLPSIISENALIIIETPQKLSAKDLEAIPDYWKLETARKYGKAHLTLFGYNKVSPE